MTNTRETVSPRRMNVSRVCTYGTFQFSRPVCPGLVHPDSTSQRTTQRGVHREVLEHRIDSRAMFPMPRHPRDGSPLSTEDIRSVLALPSVRTCVTVSKLSDARRCSIAGVSLVIEVSHLVSLGGNEVRYWGSWNVSM